MDAATAAAAAVVVVVGAVGVEGIGTGGVLIYVKMMWKGFKAFIDPVIFLSWPKAKPRFLILVDEVPP